VEWLVKFLDGRDWITAAHILVLLKKAPDSENEKRRIRALADASEGRICGHQKGYKLATSMTNVEYTWWRNEWLKSSDAIRARVMESDKIFYGRKAATN
jgi:hypothetical protein